MPVNPCGQVMDTLRRGYRQEMQGWQGDPATFTARWYRADPGAKVYSADCAYRSSNWDSAPQFAPVGEQWPRSRTYDRGQNFLGTTGQSVCGSAQAWAEGGLHGRDPEILVPPSGQCPCCAQRVQLGSLGSGSGLLSRPWQSSRLPSGSGLVSRQYQVFGQQSLVGTGTALDSDQADRHHQLSLVGSGSALVSVRQARQSQQSLIGSGSGLVSRQYQVFHQLSLIGSGTALLSTQDYSVNYIGEIRIFGWSATPAGWLECDGSQVSQATYSALYAALGATWGSPSAGNFFLPDLRRAVPMGRGGTVVFGPNNALGSRGGTEGVTLAASESGLPAHTHGPPTGGTGYLVARAGSAAVLSNGINIPFDNLSPTGANTAAAAAAAHSNVQPSAVVKFMIFAGP